MLNDLESESADQVFRRKLREKLVAHGVPPSELERKVEELMRAEVRLRFELPDDSIEA